MTTFFHSPIESAAADGEGQDDAQYALSQQDLTLSARATMSGQYLAGLILAGMVATAGAPRKLPRDLYPDLDPVVLQEVFDLGVGAGWHGRRLAERPYHYRDQIERLQGELAKAGFAAMAGMVGRSLATAVAAHPADGESDGREHRDV